MESKRTNVEKTKQVVQNSSSRRLSSIIGNRAYSDLYLPPIIQKADTVVPVGKLKTNYYIQNEGNNDKNVRKRKKLENKDEINKGKICKKSKQKYNKWQGPKSEEPGYLSFRSTKKAKNFSDKFLSETFQKNKEEWIYKKSNIDIKLPVSCIEATTWAMKTMETTSEDKTEKYPGYMSFPNEFYNAMDAVEKKKGKIDSEMNEDEMAKLLSDNFKNLRKHSYRYYLKEFKKRSTDVMLYGEENEKGNGKSSLSIDREEITNEFVTKTGEYTGNYEVGDGILIAKSLNGYSDGDAEFHAVAIVAVFDNDGFIVLERNAGSTAIQTGHLGDEHWLFNYYKSADDFKEQTQNNSDAYKAFLLRI